MGGWGAKCQEIISSVSHTVRVTFGDKINRIKVSIPYRKQIKAEYLQIELLIKDVTYFVISTPDYMDSSIAACLLSTQPIVDYSRRMH